MAVIRIKGIEYPLRYDLDAMEKIEEKFGSTKDAMAVIRSRSVKATKQMFVILANSARGYAGEAEDITEEVLAHESLRKLNELSQAFARALEEGMESETSDGGPADDEVHDIFEDEEDIKNG